MRKKTFMTLEDGNLMWIGSTVVTLRRRIMESGWAGPGLFLMGVLATGRRWLEQ